MISVRSFIDPCNMVLHGMGKLAREVCSDYTNYAPVMAS